MIIKEVGITFKGGTEVRFHDVSFFQYHDGEFFIRSRGKDFSYSIGDFVGVRIVVLEETEPSLNLPFEESSK